jgi:hypothetical protein
MCEYACREGYQARLRSIRYGADELKLADKTGDVGSAMFDSGTSFTYLVPEAYEAVLQAVSHYWLRVMSCWFLQ